MCSPENGSPVASLEGLRAQVQRAFEMARERKPQQWRTMTLAVLKNRLLQLTDRSFDEVDYGARNMQDLAALLPDLLAVDRSAVPPTVTLRADPSSGSLSAPSVRGRIRSDLWNAIVDYSSGRTWVWLDGLAVADPPDPPDSTRVLPTITAEEMRCWRDEFATAYSKGLDVDDAARVAAWAAGAGRTQELPANLRRTWNERLKANVLDRIHTWFQDRSEALPEDLVMSPIAPSAAMGRPGEEGLIAVRDFVIGCIMLMAEEELNALALPAGAVQRYLNSRVDQR
jgi:hypothetical protein